MKIAKLSKRQRFWERLWTGTILLYTFVATFIVWRTLKKYGVNPLYFFFIDALTSWSYALSTSRLIISIAAKEWKQSRIWAVAAAVSFLTPQLYILIAAQHAPKDVYRIVVGVISALATFTLITLLSEIRRGRVQIS